MLAASRADHVFSEQFEALGDGNYVYRYNRSGVAKKVSSAERTAFIDGFSKARRRASWGLVVGVLATALVLTAVFGSTDDTAIATSAYLGGGLASVGFIIFWRWAWKAPARALADRQCESPALAKGEARRAAFRRMTWGQVAFSGLVTIIGSAWLASNVDVFSGWNRVGLIGIFMLVGINCWRIWQKLQADRPSR